MHARAFSIHFAYKGTVFSHVPVLPVLRWLTSFINELNLCGAEKLVQDVIVSLAGGLPRDSRLFK